MEEVGYDGDGFGRLEDVSAEIFFLKELFLKF